MSIEELLEMAAEYNWEVKYDDDGQLIFLTGVRDESKQEDPMIFEDWDEDAVEDEFLT